MDTCPLLSPHQNPRAQPFVEGWVDAFHRNDILFLRLEDYIKDTPGTLRTVLQCVP